MTSSSADVHVFLTAYRDVEDALLKRYSGLMSSEERNRAARFRFEDDRRRYIVTRALVRTVLASYQGVAASELCFSANEFGRPVVVNPGAGLPSFNLSHTEGLIALAISHGREVGVDIEVTDPKSAAIAIADRYFAPSEVAALRHLPVNAQPARFFEYWTLKESYIKARGRGLAIALDHFAFNILPDRIQLAMTPQLKDKSRWCFFQYRPTPETLLALCIEQTATTPHVSFSRTLPLVHDDAIELPCLKRS